MNRESANAIDADNAHFELVHPAGRPKGFTVKTEDRDFPDVDLPLEEWVRRYADLQVFLYPVGVFKEHCPTCRCLPAPVRTVTLREANQEGFMELWLVDNADVNLRREMDLSA